MKELSLQLTQRGGGTERDDTGFAKRKAAPDLLTRNDVERMDQLSELHPRAELV